MPPRTLSTADGVWVGWEDWPAEPSPERAFREEQDEEWESVYVQLLFDDYEWPLHRQV